MNPETIVIAGRVVERVAAWALAALLLYFAHRALRMRKPSPQSAEMKADKFVIKLARVSPGVFFAVLGTIVLVINLRSPLELERLGSFGRTAAGQEDEKTEFRVRYSGPSQNISPVDICVAINRAKSIAEGSLVGEEAKVRVTRLRDTLDFLSKSRSALLSPYYGAGVIERFNIQRDSHVNNPDSTPEADRASFSDLERAFFSTNDPE